ncbi:hypothetical protein [Chamaesiphon sp. OTE_20_metabat_361]|uniref:hypothetical protein n=1 Tax=Chamaesiphon sp. OTE_20_metabat_361 TaxID=2964689 RepID=UPI00286D5F3F|nr:hypothetical protein [Chamaesiphon sp. OTE_20_metabat_361]
MPIANETDGHQDFFDSIDRDDKFANKDLAKLEACEDAIDTAQLKQAMAENTGFVTAVELLAMRSILPGEAIANDD